ncbi:MAG TPA: 4-hydroxy-3-methylbut-2-enyl diphosphate reductase, partial [bacterium]|nr:4-hydroxy-3-methylbut-2-enyl diphosphate reductase [bacterium]
SSLNDSFDNKLLIVENLEELEKLEISKLNRIALLSQTTQSLKKFRDCVNYLVDKCLELRIFNTICKSTEQRQLSSLELARNVDVIFVVGGKNSANTRRLYEICKNINSSTYHIEDETEIKKKYLEGKKKIGITAGASTPQDTINEIVKKLEKMIN